MQFSDKPSQPGEIEITSISKDSITIEWERPESDGGKEILGYWVEYRQSGESTWKKCNKELIKDRQFTVGGLLEATEYEFRVFAENQTGLSRPRRTAMAVKTKLTCKQKIRCRICCKTAVILCVINRSATLNTLYKLFDSVTVLKHSPIVQM